MKEGIKKFIRKIKPIHKLAVKIDNNYKKYQKTESYLHRKADYYMISFPKCGRTWLRLIVGKYIQEYYGLKDVPNGEVLELTPLAGYDPRIPMIRVTHDDDPHKKRPEELGTNKRRYRKKKIIFLVRDPRDIVVSLYFQFLKREHLIEDMSISEFIRRDEGSLKSLVKFLNIWDRNRKVPKEFMLLTYENLHRQIYGQKNYYIPVKVLRFLGFKDIDHELLSRVVEFTAFENMQEMERKGEFNYRMHRLVPTDENDIETYKVRKGEIGGYRNYCSKEDIEYMNRYIKENLSENYHY